MPLKLTEISAFCRAFSLAKSLVWKMNDRLNDGRYKWQFPMVKVKSVYRKLMHAHKYYVKCFALLSPKELVHGMVILCSHNSMSLIGPSSSSEPMSILST